MFIAYNNIIKMVLIAILMLIPSLLVGQDSIWGVVLDSLDQKPLQYVNVYVNGTTKGTVTDSNGYFELKGVSFPATVVFSFVGYRSQAHNYTNNPEELLIELGVNNELPEVVITDKNEWLQNLSYFKRMFLGEDHWGRHAIIKNEQVLFFDNSNFTRRVVINDSGYEMNEIGYAFNAWASEPLIIDLPLLGYELYVDLISFRVEQIEGRIKCNMLGYFCYNLYNNVKKSQMIQFDKNRRKAYYNSSQHFLRSLYNNRLAENGYILAMSETGIGVQHSVTKYLPVDVGLYFKKRRTDWMTICGLKYKNLKILYYHKRDGSPLDISKNITSLHSYSVSGVLMLMDTCMFHKNGTIIDNNICFIGDISEKKVGACLPDDYYPDNE